MRLVSWLLAVLGSLVLLYQLLVPGRPLAGPPALAPAAVAILGLILVTVSDRRTG
jgi:hypothetical protein